MAINVYRIESLVLVFCSLALLFIVLQPRTERLLEHIFPSSLKGFLMSLFEALSFSLMLFGVFGLLAKRGVNLVSRHPISFVVVSGIGTLLFLWANGAAGIRSGTVWPND
jgi:hypothetical protein